MNNNNNNNKKNTISDEIPLSFPDMQRKPLSKASGGTTVISSQNNQISSNDLDMFYNSSKIKSNQNQNNTQSTSSLISEPYKMMENIIQVSVVNNNDMESKANIMNENSSAFFVPSKLALCGSIRNTPAVINELNSFVVADTPMIALQACVEVMSNFDFDVIFCVDEKNLIITGGAFVTDMGVDFKICIFLDSDGTRFEITRSSGDAIDFHNFYGCMQQKLAKCLKVINGSSFAIDSPMDTSGFFFPPLPSFSMSSLDSLDFSDELNMGNIGYTNDDLNRFTDDLNEDSYQLETLGEIYTLDKKMIVNHEMLIEAVIACCHSSDIAVQRLALKIMSKVEIAVNVKSECAVIQKYINKN